MKNKRVTLDGLAYSAKAEGVFPPGKFGGVPKGMRNNMPDENNVPWIVMMPKGWAPRNCGNCSIVGICNRQKVCPLAAARPAVKVKDAYGLGMYAVKTKGD